MWPIAQQLRNSANNYSRLFDFPPLASHFKILNCNRPWQQPKRIFHWVCSTATCLKFLWTCKGRKPQATSTCCRCACLWLQLVYGETPIKWLSASNSNPHARQPRAVIESDKNTVIWCCVHGCWDIGLSVPAFLPKTLYRPCQGQVRQVVRTSNVKSADLTDSKIDLQALRRASLLDLT